MSGKRYTARELAERLIAFPTVSRDSNLDLIGFVQDYLDGWSVEQRLFMSAEEDKANLLATLRPAKAADADQGGIILSGHTDVVPVDGQDWSRPPFEPWEQGGKLFGRGSADMKSFIAIALSRVPDMLERGLKEPILLALSYDEEVGCSGVLPMIDDIARLAPCPRLCIVGEPTEMKVINAHKGIQGRRTVVRGRAGHSSAPHLGASAIEAAARLVGYLSQLAGEARAPDLCDGRFFPPYTTFNIGEIRGGNAINIIAAEAEIVWEYRPLPGFDVDGVMTKLKDFAEAEILPGLRQNAPEASIETFRLSDVPPLVADEGSDAESFVMKLALSNETGTAAYATEAGQFRTRAEIPTIVCGPGNIEQAHKPDEFITLDQLAAGEAFFDRLLDAVCV